MANLRFLGTDNQTELDCFHIDKHLMITIEGGAIESIELDIPTAIALRKHLAQEIARAKEWKEVYNG